ncbi:hypothetical protein WOLCODRAFT_138619 [Wolfiporia cocos MD-104 SS10]|uniref:Letm1 RBD domain-containing protein n=1 Tax=Wolfiporia cocos (strain MD-104) TaxID=742152 RepID=A0A2H3JY60_WOLCO|nr:hypothetical protein WOLCODRAFT_138619 [Wolfiporia cocos MD-104 SS10]
MLSTLGRNGFVESLAATRHHRSAILLQCRLRHTISRNADILPCHASAVFAAYRPAPRARLLSTSPPPTPTPAKASTGQTEPSPPPVSPSRKHKVELRPGPVKPPKPTPAPGVPPPAPAPASTSASPAKSEGLVDATKKDLEDASQHGILAPPPPDASWAGRLWHQAKELFKFYFRGIKLIAIHRRRVRELEARVRAGGPPLTRRELRFIATNQQDLNKLVPFLLIIIIIEEILPLVVLYAPFLLPSTCLLPSQKARIDEKRREKQQLYAKEYKSTFLEILAAPGAMKSSSLAALNGLLSLPTMSPDALRLRRLRKHLAAIAEDDTIIEREGRGDQLSAEELRDALEARGIIAEGMSAKTMHSRLQWWLTNAEQGDADPIERRIVLVARVGAGKL